MSGNTLSGAVATVSAAVSERTIGLVDRAASRRAWLTLYPVWILVIASVVSWRRGVIYDGGLDPVVVAKAAVSVAALGLAAIVTRTAPKKRSIGLVGFFAVLLIVAISTLGATTGTDFLAGLVLTVRIMIVVATVMLVVRAYESRHILETLLAAMGSVGAVAGITGFSNVMAGGRLFGGIPPLAPNELAALLIAPFIAAFFSLVDRGLKLWNVVATAAFGYGIYVTGSRTGLIVAIVSVVIVLIIAPRVPSIIIVATIIAAPVAYVIVAFTGTVSELALRGGNVQSLLTLNTRTNAWDAVLGIPDNSWQKWIGAGLSVKKVTVTGQYWKSQVLDSSWISSLAQSGIIGTIILAGLVIFVLVRSMKTGPLRPLLLALVVMIVIRSFLENGLIESSATFVLFLTIALIVDPNTGKLASPVKADPWREPVASHHPRQLATPRAWLASTQEESQNSSAIPAVIR